MIMIHIFLQVFFFVRSCPLNYKRENSHRNSKVVQFIKQYFGCSMHISFFMKSSVKFTALSCTKSVLQKLGNQVLVALYFQIFLSANQYTTYRFLAMINFQSLFLPSFLIVWQFCEYVKILTSRTHWSNVFKNIL